MKYFWWFALFFAVYYIWRELDAFQRRYFVKLAMRRY